MGTLESGRHGTLSAAGYIRRSTNKQEKSLDDQRYEIERYAADQGYQIVRWFQDDAISGDATEVRHGFLEMHRQACGDREFDVILCWDQDRFGRFSPHEASYWTFPLAKAGVTLVTVTGGPVDWHDFTNWLTYSVNQHGKHQFLKDHSKNVSRGHLRNARAGYSCGQAAPYGYDRMLCDENGNHKQRVRNREQYAKPRSWHVTWVPSDDPVKVSTVQWLFETYARQDVGYRSMADDLNRRGVPSPSGGQWFDSTVRAILQNQAYIGTFVWNKRRMGKYHRIVNGEIVERDRAEVKLMPNGKPNATHNPKEAWTVVENSHEPLVDRETFDVVQGKIERRSRKNCGGYRTHTKQNGDAYLLTGLVFCEHCGRRMHGTTFSRKKNGKTYRYPKYLCSTFTRSGANNEFGCHQYGIHQDAIVDAVLRKFREMLLAGGNIDRLKTELRHQLQAAHQPDSSHLEGLRRRHKELVKQVDKGAERLLTAPESLLDVLTEKLSAMKRERDSVAAELKRAEQAAKPIDVDAEVDKAATKVWALDAELKDAPRARMRELLGQLVERVELRFSPHQNGKRREFRPTGGRIFFRGESLGFASRGEPSFTQLKIPVTREDVRQAA